MTIVEVPHYRYVEYLFNFVLKVENLGELVRPLECRGRATFCHIEVLLLSRRGVHLPGATF